MRGRRLSNTSLNPGFYLLFCLQVPAVPAEPCRCRTLADPGKPLGAAAPRGRVKVSYTVCKFIVHSIGS